MKKIILPAGIILFCLFTLLSSCKPKDSKVKESVTLDSTNSNTKEINEPGWNTNSELITGYLQTDLKVDGAAVDTKSSEITIRPKTDFSAIKVESSKGTLMLKSGWHGIGDYDKAYAEWNDISEGGPGEFRSDYNAPGRMTITNWGPGKVEGTFSVTVIENNVSMGEPHKKLIEGAFHYLRDK